MGNKIQVSIILLIYNNTWEKIRLTLESILRQKNIEMEIILADDGSQVHFDKEIREVCGCYGFEKYSFSNNKKNMGTCKNLFEAMKYAKGKYVKLISPGDVFFDENSLKDWISFMEKEQCKFSFCNTVYYRIEHGNLVIVKERHSPICSNLFSRKQSRRKIFVDYLLANDTILGASVMMTQEMLIYYLNLIVGKVIYAEDFMLRLAVFENRKILYFENKAIWYEYGDGISTKGSRKWSERIYKDFLASDMIIYNCCEITDKIAKHYIKYLKNRANYKSIHKIYKCFMFPELIYWRIRNYCFKIENNNDEIDISFLNGLFAKDVKRRQNAGN